MIFKVHAGKIRKSANNYSLTGSIHIGLNLGNRMTN